ncbi:Uncharacterised protein [Mycobacteroides abscessus subsp. abscessus]|nr:Uncharacterised protein [Mycobacteroides abscessus subsp. abscessus]SIL13165.1 Uncharacterised protein [Mycobacteroides abscessus subsp. abscessus]
MQSVGADDEVESLIWGPVEADSHAGAVVGQVGDRIAEDVLGAGGAGAIQDLTEVISHDLDVPFRHGREDQHLGKIDGPLACAMY